MKVLLFTCFILISFTQGIPSSCNLDRNLEQRVLNSSKNNMQTQHPLENYGSKKEKQELSYESTKTAHGHSGKGANGGGNVDHHRPRGSRNSAPLLLSWISTLLLSFILMLIFFFHAKLF